MKEVAPDGSKDENVFDIQAGVSINIFIKTGRKKESDLAEVYHCGLWGKREKKFDILEKDSLQTLPLKKVDYFDPYYFFVPKDKALWKKYMKIGFPIQSLFPVSSVGVVTAKDDVFIANTSKELEEQVRKEFSVFEKKYLQTIAYRPFDNRKIYYDTGKIERDRQKVMQHFFNDNVGICACRQFRTGNRYQHVFIADRIMESCFVSNKGSEITSIFPLYTYPDIDLHQDAKGMAGPSRKPNFNKNIIDQITKDLRLTFVSEVDAEDKALSASKRQKFAPIDVLDYIYAVLHSPIYRKTYAEPLKIDFPRVPYPRSAQPFWELVALGAEIRQLHLLKSDRIKNPVTDYPISGENIITRKVSKRDFQITSEGVRLWINDNQYFDKIPLAAWEFYIGGYQPAQKYIKDRHKTALNYDDITHYQKIITALYETHKIMENIDNICI